MFPILLDDRSLFTEFENFIEAVDNMHELALGGHQQFPVFCCCVLFAHVFSLAFIDFYFFSPY